MWEILSKFLKNEILDKNEFLQQTYDFEAADAESTPFASITPSANESEYHSTNENERVYAFLVRLYVLRKSGEGNEKDAEDAMRQLVDSVIDDLDKNERLNGLDTKTGYCFILMEAAPSAWGYAGRANMYRVAEITLNIRYLVDVDAIS